jgi:alpha-tubulin suppressor-like RCC1 family protein
MRRHVVLVLTVAACAGPPRGDVRGVEMEIGRTANAPLDETPPSAPRSELAAMMEGICELVDGVVRCAGKINWAAVGELRASPDWLRVPGTEGAAQLTAGGQHACVRINDGTARCWGTNEFAQLGDGVGGEPRAAPVNVSGVRDIVELRAGLFHTCARVRNGDVLCWGGKIDSVQLPFDLDPSSRLHPTRIARGATQLVMGHERTYARTSDGWVTWAPKRGAAPVPVLIPELADAVDIVAGFTEECAVTAAGAVRCWKASHPSTSSAGLVPNAALPVQKLPPAVRVAIGNRNACALVRDGRVFCWGLLFAGDVPAPAAAVAGIEGAIDLTAGFGFACARLRSGSVRCWGTTEFSSAESAR